MILNTRERAARAGGGRGLPPEFSILVKVVQHGRRLATLLNRKRTLPGFCYNSNKARSRGGLRPAVVRQGVEGMERLIVAACLAASLFPERLLRRRRDRQCDGIGRRQWQPQGPRPSRRRRPQAALFSHCRASCRTRRPVFSRLDRWHAETSSQPNALMPNQTADQWASTVSTTAVDSSQLGVPWTRPHSSAASVIGCRSRSTMTKATTGVCAANFVSTTTTESDPKLYVGNRSCQIRPLHPLVRALDH